MRNQLVPQSNTLDLMPETKRPKSVIADLDHQSVSDNDEDDQLSFKQGPKSAHNLAAGLEDLDGNKLPHGDIQQ